jgi:hypothetical protein
MTELVNSVTTPKGPSQSSSMPSSGNQSRPSSRPSSSSTPSSEDVTNIANCFVVDSFNIHRLVIAGVTCASKFFSDVFYTNSRYAKVKHPSLDFPSPLLLYISTKLPAHSRRLADYHCLN